MSLLGFCILLPQIRFRFDGSIKTRQKIKFEQRNRKLTIKAAASGDFDGDGVDSVVAFYDYDNSQTQKIWGFTAYNGSTFTPQVWFDSTVNTIDFERIKHVSAGDYDGDGKDELVVLMDLANGEQDFYLFNYANGAFTLNVGYNNTASSFPFANVPYIVSGNFDNDSADELAVYYNYAYGENQPSESQPLRLWLFDTHNSSNFSHVSGNNSNLKHTITWDQSSRLLPKQVISGNFYNEAGSKDEIVSFYK